MNNDLEKLIDNLPLFLQKQLNQHSQKNKLIEIVIDLGRRPEVRFANGHEYLSQKIISWQDIDYMTKRISKFSSENRAGIDRTLHRISCIRNRQYLINGFTCRVGRAVVGTISVIRDLLELEKSILILGKPGIGKTTVIREIARILADEMEKRVIIIDTSNEIAGDSDVPHFGIGRARRMQVTESEFQHKIMMEAVENHMPQVIIIDEIGTELEVLAARTIAEKGVQLVGTTHGNCLENLIKNPLLIDLIGGIQFVTLSDEEAKRRRTQKSILERKTYPAFEIAIEINNQNVWTIHEDIKRSVDLFLRRNFILGQTRKLSMLEKIKIKSKRIRILQNLLVKNKINLKTFIFSNYKTWILLNNIENNKSFNLKPISLIIFTYSLSYNLIKKVLRMANFKFVITNDIDKAMLAIGLKQHLKHNLNLIHLVNSVYIPIYVLDKLDSHCINKLILFIFGLLSSDPSRNPNRKDFE